MFKRFLREFVLSILKEPVVVKIVRRNNEIPLPRLGTSGSAACDIITPETVTIPPHETVCVSSGLRVELPHGYEMNIDPRSSTFRKGLMVAGKIDSDFRGEFGIVIQNVNIYPITIEQGQRIAQVTVRRVEAVRWCETVLSDLSITVRGEKGFGSTGE